MVKHLDAPDETNDSEIVHAKFALGADGNQALLDVLTNVIDRWSFRCSFMGAKDT